MVSNFIVQALRGAPMTLYGDGSQTRAFCFVDDMVEGLLRMMATADAVTGPVNLGNPQEIPVRKLAERIVQLTGSASAIVSRPLPQDDPVQRCPDIALARRTLDWAPVVGLNEGLERTVAYFARLLAEQGELPLREEATPVWRPTLVLDGSL